MGALSWQRLDQLGATDCEAIGGAFLSQPVNALSSLVYLAVGGWLLRRARATDAAAPAHVFAVAVVTVGLGSFAFHGPMFSGAQFLHDLSIAGLFVTVLTYGRSIAWSLSDRVSAGAGAAMALGAAVVLLIAPPSGVIVIGVLAVAAVASEIARFRTGDWSVTRREAGLLRWTLLAAAGAVVANVTGRTGGLLCDPDSLLQGHAVWHIVTAFVLGVYGRTAFEGASRPAHPKST